MNNDKKSVLKSKFFLKLFGIPSVIWFIISLLAMIYDEADKDPLTLSDLILADIILIGLWFIISLLISLYVVTRKRKVKIVKEVQYIKKTDEKVVTKLKKETTKKEKMIEILKKEKKDKPLHVYEGENNAYEYGKMAKYFLKRTYFPIVYLRTIYIILLTFIIFIIYQNFSISMCFFLTVQIIMMIYNLVKLDKVCEKLYNDRLKKGIEESNCVIFYYDDYYIRIGETYTITVKYSDITRCVETDTNIYLEYGSKNLVSIIQKNNCDSKTIKFIRDKVNNIEEYSKDKKIINNPNFIKKIMSILFIITIFSFFGAIFSAALINNTNFGNIKSFTKNTWIIWCWLPIPVLSIIFGCIYKNKKINCSKNIVSGVIVSILLLIFSSISFFHLSVINTSYNNIYELRDIMGLNIPKETLNYNSTQYLISSNYNNKKYYKTMLATYDYENNTKIIESIKSNPNWILSSKYNKQMKEFFSSGIEKNKYIYYLIYNETTKEYNTLPKENGKYKILEMSYDINYSTLIIQSYEINYKNHNK